jgi:gliding motility-associated-like protein
MAMNWRNLLLSFSIGCIFTSFSQEVNHDHSIHHSFLENKGQWHDDVLFKTKFDGGNLWIQKKKLMFHIQDYRSMEEAHKSPMKQQAKEPEFNQTVLHVNFPGANDNFNIEKQEPTKAYFNFFKGNDPDKWASEVRGYGEAILRDYYDGIDLKFIEQENQLKYEFHVLPESDPSKIILNYAGHEKIKIDKKGRLVVSTELGDIIEEKPYAYQIVNGNIREVECNFKLEGSNVTFDLGDYNPFATLVIDPVLVFATYCGSVTDNFGMTATYGYDGTAYSGGVIYGNSYPTPDPLAYDVTSNFTVPNNGQGAGYGITDAFITKYDPDGTTMLWTTFYGGGDDLQGTETAHSLICDQNNNIYIYGATSSTDLPIVGGYQSSHAGGSPNSNHYYNGVYFSNQGTDIFVAKFSANGQNLMASTYIGGSLNDGVNYKVTSGIYNNVAAYDSLTLNYGDQFRGEIMIDSLGNCIVASCSWSTDFPTQTPFQAANGGNQDGVIFKLSSDLSTLQWSSYYGGWNNDACYSVKIDSSYNIVFAGGTSSNDLITTPGTWQPGYNGGKTDGFVAKLDPTGTTLTAATFLGTNNYDQAFFVEIDRNDNVFVLGQSEGGNFPVINAAFVNPGSSQFVVKLDPGLVAPINSTVFGNGNPTINISPAAFLVDICGNIYISGWGANILQATPMGGMPVSPPGVAFQDQPPNGFDFYLLVIEREMLGMLYGTYLGGGSANEHVDGGTSRFDKNGVVYQSVCGGCGGFSDFPTTPGAYSSQNLSTNCNNLIFKFDFELIPNAEFTADNTLGCATFQVTFDNNSTQGDAYVWDFGNGDTTSVIFNPTMVYDTAGIYDVYLYVTDSICLLTDTAQITITVTDSLEISTSPDLDLCQSTLSDLIAYTNGTADQFIWSSNINFTDTLNTNFSDSIFSTTPPGPMTYYVEASNAGCSIVDSVVVNFIGANLILQAMDSICAGEQTLITATNTNPAITFDYTWTPDSVIVTPSITNTVIVAPNTTQYIYVTASSNTGCIVNDSILIHVGNIPNGLINASASQNLVAAGTTVTLLGSPSGYSYTWSPSEGVASVNSQNTQAVVDQTTIYTLTATDGICTKSDTVIVSVYDFICEEPYLFIPNAFSPNGDGENDVLYVRGPAIKEMTFRIYDRWGELVFESFDRLTGWDGKFRGKDLDPDVYDYYLKVICVDDVESIIKGNITLMR